MTAKPVKRRALPKRLFVAFVSLLLADQLLLYTVLSDGILLGNSVAPFAQPLFSARQRAIFAKCEAQITKDPARFEREAQFDAELGWCPPRDGRHGEAEFDWAGSRLGPEPLPRERDGSWMIGLVGCSFTLGSEVEDEETWAYELDVRWKETRIGNFGVGGYGVDQALLRYRRDVAPLEPDEVWLGFFPHAALRASSRFPPLFARWRAPTLLFKPRFALDSAGELVLQPSPARTPEDIVRLVRDPAAFLEALEGDPWIARAPAAYLPHGRHWTHHSAFTRVLLTLYERRGRAVPPLLAEESSELFRLHRALVLALAGEVRAAGARFRMLVLPSRNELEELTRTGAGYWQPLARSLEASGIEVLDLTEKLLAAGVDQGDPFWMPEGHYSPRTNRLVAAAIAEVWSE